MSILHTLWRLMNSRQRRQLLGLQLLAVLAGLSTVGGVASILPFFAALSDPNTILHNALARGVLLWLNVGQESIVPALGAAFAVSVLIANAANLLCVIAINRFSGRVGETLYAQLFTEYLHRGYEFHAHRGSSVLASKVQESARVTSGIVQYALVLVTSLVTIAFIVIAMVLINPVVAIAAITALGASYVALYAGARKRLRRNGHSEHQLRSERMRTVGEAFGAIKDVTLLGVEDYFASRFALQSRRISKAGASTFAISQSPKYMLECVTVICLVGVALYVRSRVGATGPWVGQLTFVGFAAYRLLPALQQAFTAIVNIRSDRAAFCSVEMDLGRSVAERDRPRAMEKDQTWRGRPLHEVRLCGLSFRYSPELPPAIDEVSLVIPAGAIVGFKGVNGSGKTTLLDLVSGLLSPQSGHVEVDGIHLRPKNRRAWQSSIAYVPQHVFLFEATLAENIALGVPPSQIDPDRLRTAAQLACLTDCVARFPAAYNERVGEGGRGLSGGERQRIAIARAIYRNASLLIFDEATSSLDTSSEQDVGDMLKMLRGDRTVLIVAHRTSALRHCDVIHELDSGKIVQEQLRAPSLSRKAGHA